MSIVTFWGSGKEQVGKTLSAVAIATNMAIEHNKRILLISASYNNDTIKNCYWNEDNNVRNSIFKHHKAIEIDNGIEGLARIIASNKVTPNLIADYTKTIFKDRLEILLGFEHKTALNSEQVGKIYSEIVESANKYYDMVFVDLDNEIDITGTEEILNQSDLVIAMASQRLASLKIIKNKIKTLPKGKAMILVGRYDKNSKYTLKNLSRATGERRTLLGIPYNTLFFESAQEGEVAELFLKLRRIEDKNDKNIFFMEQVKIVTEEILNKIIEDNLMMNEGR